MTGAGVPVAAFAYDRRTIRMHWISAALVIALWCLGQTIDWFPRGTPRSLARSVHIALGVTLAVVILMRIVWRLGGGRKLPASERGPTQAVAGFIHAILYLLLVSALLAGIANVWVRGDTLFQWFTVPAWDPSNKELRHQVEDIHELLANTVFFLALMHAGVAIAHHAILRDNVLRRMIPALKAPATNAKQR